MQSSELENVAANYQFYLKRAIGDLGGKQQISDSYFTIAFSHRVLALCELLMNADQERYLYHLTCAGQARLAFLKEVAEKGLEAEPKYLLTSKNQGFAAALVAGDLKTAREIARLSAPEFSDGYEYEEDFLFYYFMQQFLLQPTKGVAHKPMLQRWTKVLENAGSGYLDACEGLASKDAEVFQSGLEALVATREAEFEGYKQLLTFDPGLYACEGKIFIEGLAVLRLAELVNIKLPDLPLKLLPRNAFVPMGKIVPLVVDFLAT